MQESVSVLQVTQESISGTTCHVHSTWTCTHVPPSKKRSGEQSQISWHFPCNSKICSSPFEYPYFFEQVVHKMFWTLLDYTVVKRCSSPRNLTWFTRPFRLVGGWGLGTRLNYTESADEPLTLQGCNLETHGARTVWRHFVYWRNSWRHLKCSYIMIRISPWNSFVMHLRMVWVLCNPMCFQMELKDP